MKIITIQEFEANIEKYIEAAQGEDVLIMDGGKAVSKLVAATGTEQSKGPGTSSPFPFGDDIVSNNTEVAKRAERVMKILREEFGINSEAELDEAIRRLPRINLAPFVCVPQSPARPVSTEMSVDSPADIP